MSMSDHERALLVTGTLDTSGVGGSPYANLDQVAVAFGAEVHEGDHIPQEAKPVVLPSGREVAAEDVETVTLTALDGTEVQALMVAATEEELAAVGEEEMAESGPTEPVKPAPVQRAKRTPAKKAQASAPAEK